MEHLEQYITAKLQTMQDGKKNADPAWVTKAELFSAFDKDLRAILNKLYNEKKIRVHKTIHAPIQDFVELVENK